MSTFWKTFWAALLGVIVGFILHFILIIMLIGGLVSLASKSDVKPAIATNSMLKIDLSSLTLAERTGGALSLSDAQYFILGGGGPTIGIYDAIEAVKEAAQDPKIKMLYISSDYTTSAGVANLEELREAIKSFRASGKPVIAYGMNFTLGGYYLASVADKIYMNTEGSAMISGLGGNMLFYKELIDKLGLDVQLIRHGKFKAAAEQYIASNISQENREQNEVLLNSIWSTWSDEICKSRGISADSLNYAIDNLKLYDAQSMMDAHLIDSIYSATQLDKKFCQYMDVENPDKFESVSLLTYSESIIRKNKATDKIAILYGDGEITMDGTSGIAAKKFVKDIQKIRKDKKIKAVVFRVNSPGGDAQAAEIIRAELEELQMEKPVVVSFGEYAASGGYWISAQSSKIFADNTTITGSIGVFSLAISYGNALKKNFGINNAVVGTHKHAAMGSGVNPLSNDEVEYMQKSIERIYTKFTNLVADGRNLTPQYVDSIGQGRVWSGADGLQIHLVDQIGGLQDAIAYAALLIDEDSESTDYKIVEYPALKSQWESILENINGGVSLSANDYIQNKIEAYKKELVGLHTYTRIPYIYQLNY